MYEHSNVTVTKRPIETYIIETYPCITQFKNIPVALMKLYFCSHQNIVFVLDSKGHVTKDVPIIRTPDYPIIRSSTYRNPAFYFIIYLFFCYFFYLFRIASIFYTICFLINCANSIILTLILAK